MTAQQKSDIWGRYARLNEELASYMAPVEPSRERILRAKSLDEVEGLALAFPPSFDLGTVSPRFSIRGNRYRRRREALVPWPKTLRVAREPADLLAAWCGRVIGLESMASELRGIGRIGPAADSASATLALAQELVQASRDLSRHRTRWDQRRNDQGGAPPRPLNSSTLCLTWDCSPTGPGAGPCKM